MLGRADPVGRIRGKGGVFDRQFLRRPSRAERGFVAQFCPKVGTFSRLVKPGATIALAAAADRNDITLGLFGLPAG
jgi:hypothetical protein